MSFGRYAYRHAVVPSSTPFIDHVWISEELLTSTFRRFVNSNGQRRYESRVPGPLEARRRLAKRKNTALADIAGSGPLDDIACLLGRNGREHMKWSDPGRTLGNDTLALGCGKHIDSDLIQTTSFLRRTPPLALRASTMRI